MSKESVDSIYPHFAKYIMYETFDGMHDEYWKCVENNFTYYSIVARMCECVNGNIIIMTISL